MSEQTRSDPLKSFFIGIALLLAGFMFWEWSTGDILNDLLLVREKSTIVGELVRTIEDEQEDSRGRVIFSDIGVYRFRVGEKMFQSITRKPTGTLPEFVDVEFIQSDPSINRIAGDGAQSELEWAWRKLGLSLILLIMFCSIGFYYCYCAAADILRAHRSPGI
ncbi:MAG: hypothetical protein K0M70_02125 [Arenimonas sp.]|uniref:hypothetical protein n=1 Tax=Arenimonas sp. TaxID=1872635 RepID=UPI0025BE7A0C|nr:hypothetical protein [Arenimonas sp.]MBW8366640.1 hypothetical protein [Arenimonas sp.]